jgi:hypothetical protein
LNLILLVFSVLSVLWSAEPKISHLFRFSKNKNQIHNGSFGSVSSVSILGYFGSVPRFGSFCPGLSARASARSPLFLRGGSRLSVPPHSLTRSFLPSLSLLACPACRHHRTRERPLPMIHGSRILASSPSIVRPQAPPARQGLRTHVAH